MVTKNMAYDHPAYISRNSYVLGANAAGAGSATQFPKFVAFSALTVFSVTAANVASGTSTYTAWNGTATTSCVGADSYSLYRVYNTAAIGAAPGLATATYGPYAISNYNGTQTATQTNSSAPGWTNNYPLGGTGGAAAVTVAGGVSVNQGDQLYVQRGTDATAVTAFAIEYGITPLANVTA